MAISSIKSTQARQAKKKNDPIVVPPLVPYVDENDPRLAQCRELDSTLSRQWRFLDEGKSHPKLSREQMVTRFDDDLHKLFRLCVAINPNWPHGYSDAKDCFALDAVDAWRHELKKFRNELENKAKTAGLKRAAV
jgi:hypothetical protein